MEPTEQSSSMRPPNEHGFVFEVLERYLRGHADSAASLFRQSLLPTAHIEEVRDGVFTSWSLDQYCTHFGGDAAGDENAQTSTIDWIEVSGDAATAKSTRLRGVSKSIDYFLLLKLDGRWAITNMVCHRVPG